MLKEGHKHLFGLHEVVLKNIDAYKQVSTITRTSFNPNGKDDAYSFLFSLFFLFAPSIVASSDSKSLDFYNVGMCSFSCYVDLAFYVMQCFEILRRVENK